jgi:hypothetical protein
MLLAITPRDQLPAYLWVFDRLTGRHSKAEASAARRTGATPWALLFYPEDIAPVDPNASLSKSAADESSGTYLFRNRWKDGGDVQVTVNADHKRSRHLGQTDTADAFGITLLAGGHRLISGSGPALPHMFSSLLVDGRPYANRGDTGSTERFEAATDGGGYVVIDGGQKYQRLGLTSAKRHVLVDFSTLPGAAILATLDRLRASTDHRYSWQINIGSFLDEAGLISERRAGGKSFVVRAPDETTLLGMVAASADVGIIADDPVQVVASGTDMDIMVVMVLGHSEAPVARIDGVGLDARVSIDNTVVRYDKQRGRLVVDKKLRTRSQN